MNTISISGNVGKDAEIREFSDNKLLSFSVADSQYKDKTVWFRCKLWGKRAEQLHGKILKGTGIHVIGEMTSSEFEDKEGNKRESWEVRVRDVNIIKWSDSYNKNEQPAEDDFPEDEAPF